MSDQTQPTPDGDAWNAAVKLAAEYCGETDYEERCRLRDFAVSHFADAIRKAVEAEVAVQAPDYYWCECGGLCVRRRGLRKPCDKCGRELSERIVPELALIDLRTKLAAAEHLAAGYKEQWEQACAGADELRRIYEERVAAMKQRVAKAERLLRKLHAAECPTTDEQGRCEGCEVTAFLEEGRPWATDTGA